MKKANLPAVTLAPPSDMMGPAMSALTEKQQAFVIAMLETGGGNHALAARVAGYADTDGAARVRGHQNMRNLKILAALREEADKRIRSGALLGASALWEIAKDTTHKDRFKASVELLNRSGLQVVTQHKVIVEDNRSQEEIVARAVALAQKLGVDPKKLLADYGVVLDADFTIVEEQANDVPYTDEQNRGDHSTSSADGLEDLL